MAFLFLTFIGYKQTNKQTNTQTDKPNLYIDEYFLETKISLLELRSLAVITVTIPSPPPLMSGQHIFRSFFILCLAWGIFSGPPPFFFTSFSILRPFTLFFRIPCIPHGPPYLPHLQPLYSLEYLAPPPSLMFVFIIE